MSQYVINWKNSFSLHWSRYSGDNLMTRCVTWQQCSLSRTSTYWDHFNEEIYGLLLSLQVLSSNYSCGALILSNHLSISVSSSSLNTHYLLCYTYMFLRLCRCFGCLFSPCLLPLLQPCHCCHLLTLNTLMSLCGTSCHQHLSVVPSSPPPACTLHLGSPTYLIHLGSFLLHQHCCLSS